jgi:hypothetical protein
MNNEIEIFFGVGEMAGVYHKSPRTIERALAEKRIYPDGYYCRGDTRIALFNSRRMEGIVSQLFQPAPSPTAAKPKG